MNGIKGHVVLTWLALWGQTEFSKCTPEKCFIKWRCTLRLYVKKQSGQLLIYMGTPKHNNCVRKCKFNIFLHYGKAPPWWRASLNFWNLQTHRKSHLTNGSVDWLNVTNTHCTSGMRTWNFVLHTWDFVKKCQTLHSGYEVWKSLTNCKEKEAQVVVKTSCV